MDIEDIAKRRGFFWQSCEIYGGISGFYDYGPLGALLKLRIENLIRDYYIKEENCLLIDASLLTSENPWIASGHVSSFSDMLTDCKECGQAYRADHLVEEKLDIKTEGMKVPEIQELMEKNKIKCPKCKGSLDKIYDYNLLFKSFIGSGKDKMPAIMRPETAQTIYMSFKRLFEIGRKKLPLGVIQIGKSFRNEISPRKALVRLREFTQAEIQFFIHPKQKNEWNIDEIKDEELHVLTKDDQNGNKAKKVKIGELVKKKQMSSMIAYFLAKSVHLYSKMGIDEKKLRLRQHKDEERSFYSSDTWDVEFISDNYGKIELVGIADRSDYDLKKHMEFSKADMRVDFEGEKFIPHVVEVSYGIDRPLLCIMESCVKKDNDRVYFSFPPYVSPYQIAVFPLVSKDGLPEKAKEVYNILEKEFFVLYDKGFIGKLYYRQDEAGTPFCITIDYETLKDNTVTIRHRDTQRQIRVSVNGIVGLMQKLVNNEIVFEKAGKVIK
ncbi:MAG: glycine--tRNA ligase [Candidatus Aenigmatarchaeota archaeon]